MPGLDGISPQQPAERQPDLAQPEAGVPVEVSVGPTTAQGETPSFVVAPPVDAPDVSVQDASAAVSGIAEAPLATPTQAEAPAGPLVDANHLENMSSPAGVTALENNIGHQEPAAVAEPVATPIQPGVMGDYQSAGVPLSAPEISAAEPYPTQKVFPESVREVELDGEMTTLFTEAQQLKFQADEYAKKMNEFNNRLGEYMDLRAKRIAAQQLKTPESKGGTQG